MTKKNKRREKKQIPADEPTFLIRGQDMLAARTIRFWILQAERAGVNFDKLANTQKDLARFEDFALTKPKRTKLPD